MKAFTEILVQHFFHWRLCAFQVSTPEFNSMSFRLGSSKFSARKVVAAQQPLRQPLWLLVLLDDGFLVAVLSYLLCRASQWHRSSGLHWLTHSAVEEMAQNGHAIALWKMTHAVAPRMMELGLTPWNSPGAMMVSSFLWWTYNSPKIQIILVLKSGWCNGGGHPALAILEVTTAILTAVANAAFTGVNSSRRSHTARPSVRSMWFELWLQFIGILKFGSIFAWLEQDHGPSLVSSAQLKNFKVYIRDEIRDPINMGYYFKSHKP